MDQQPSNLNGNNPGSQNSGLFGTPKENRQSEKPGQGPQEAFTAEVSPNPGQPIIIQMPRQRASKAPWIILGLIILAIVLSMTSCVVAPFVMMNSSSSSSPASSFYSSMPIQKDSVGVIDWSDSISASSGITPDGVMEQLDVAEENPHIKAVVVRCNCPGGTVAASEEIASYIKNFEKPIVFSVSDLCASGAYMGASQSDYIMAMSMSEVGSIGVIMSTVDISELLDKLGIKMDSIKSSEGKDAGAYYRSLTEEEKAAYQKKIQELNQKFINMVAEGRGLDPNVVSQYATGETFDGDHALKIKLIDGIGTYKDALDKAAEMGGIEGDNYQVYPLTTTDPFSSLGLFGFEGYGNSENIDIFNEIRSLLLYYPGTEAMATE